MTIQEASEKLHIRAADLEYYGNNDLFDLKELEENPAEVESKEINNIRLIDSLAKTGIELKALKQMKMLLDQGERAKEEQIKFLKKQRFQLLDDLHGRQKSLDCLDFIIYNLKKQ